MNPAIYFFLLASLCCSSLLAQDDINHRPKINIQFCENQTTHLVFPSDILYTDVGDQQQFIIAYTNNILRIKGLENNKISNLTVITKDQHFYSFYLKYTPNPQLNYFIYTHYSIRKLSNDPLPIATDTLSDLASKDKAQSKTKPSLAELEAKPPKTRQKSKTPKVSAAYKAQKRKRLLENKARVALKKPAIYSLVYTKHGDIKLNVSGIYHNLDNCFVVYELQNKGAIPYDIEYLEFGIKPKKRPKKSAIQEQQLIPHLILKKDWNRILPHTAVRYVAVFDKLAPAKGEILYIKVVENGRNLFLKIPFNRLPIARL